MRSLILALICLASCGDCLANTESRIVKIHVVQQAYNVTRPWLRGSPSEVSGSGFVIGSNSILTNAHVVRNARQVYIQPFQSSHKIEAEVVFFAEGIDLALLKTDDAEFADFDAYSMDQTIPKVGQTVNISGYPVGGDEMSTTEGVVSRIEHTYYNNGVSGLRLQVDAAINSGNSGGPAFINDKFSGIVFSKIREADNIGYVIPIEEILLFLKDIEDGTYDGKPLLLFNYIGLQNQNLRDQYGLAPEQGGILVNSILDNRIKENGFKERDVILKFGDYHIDRNGYVKINDELRLNFAYLLPQLLQNNRLPFTVLRDGELLDLWIKPSPDRNLLVPYIGQTQPTYFIYGPLHFIATPQSYLAGMPKQLRETLSSRGYEPLFRRYEQKKKLGEELIMAPSKMFAHPMTKGIRDPHFSVLKEVNGVEILNMEHLVKKLSKLDPDDFVEFTFAEVDHNRKNIVLLKHKEVLRAMEDILSDNGIRVPYSKDLAHLWEDY